MADVRTLCGQASHEIDQGRIEEGLKLIDEALQTAPTDADALLLKAEGLVLADRWEEAEETLQDATQHHPKNPNVLLAMADLIVDFYPDDEAAVSAAHEMAMRAATIARRQKPPDKSLLGELHRVSGRALAALGDSVGAVRAFESAREMSGDDPELLIDLAMSQFEALQLDEARTLLTSLLKTAPDDARVHHYLGLLEERGGRSEEAEKFFARARKLDPDEFPRPTRLTEEQFNATIQKALDGLPDRVRAYIANVPVLVDDLPSTEDLSGDPPLSPLSLGMFRGTPGAQKSHLDPWSNMPSSIVLYQKNLERYCATREELMEEIETTLLHEVGHYLGWDEDDLYERDLD